MSYISSEDSNASTQESGYFTEPICKKRKWNPYSIYDGNSLNSAVRKGKGRRRYIARGETGETTACDPATFHPPSTSKAPQTGGDREPTARAHTFDAPASGTNVSLGPPGGAAGLARSHTTEGAIGLSQPFTSQRSGDADTRAPFSSQYGRRDSGSSDTSFRSAHSDISGGLTTRGCFGSKDSGSAGFSTSSYPATFPGPKVRWQYNPLAEISEAGKGEKYQEKTPLPRAPPSKVGVFNPAINKSASLPVGTAPPHSGHYESQMDQSGCTGYKYGLKQGIAALFGSKKAGSESTVGKPAQEGSKSHSVSDIVQCSPKQAKRFSGHFQAVNIDIDEPDGTKNDSTVKPPWQQTPKEKYTYQPIRPKNVESVTNKGIQTSLSSGPTFHSPQVPYTQQAVKVQPQYGGAGMLPSSYPYSNVQTLPTTTVSMPYSSNVPTMQVPNVPVPYSHAQTFVTTSAPSPYSNVQTISKPEPLQRTSSKNITTGVGNLTKEERIAQYKDKRRKELASMFSSSDKSSVDYGEDLSSNIIKKTQATKGWSKEEKHEKKDPTIGTIAPIAHPSATTFSGKSISPKPIMPDVQISAEMAPNLSPSGNVPDILASTHPSAFTKVLPSSHKPILQSSVSSQMPLSAVSKASAPSLARSPKPATTSHKDVLPPWKQPPVVTTAVMQEPVIFTEKQPAVMASAPIRPIAITTSISTITSQTSASLSSVFPVSTATSTFVSKVTPQDYVASGKKRSSLDSEISKMDAKNLYQKNNESVILHFPSAVPTVTTASLTTSSVSLMPVETLSPATSRRSRLITQKKTDLSSSLEPAKPKLTSDFKATEQSTSLDRLIEGLDGLAAAADRTEFMEGLATISDPSKPRPVKKSESLTCLELGQLPRKVQMRKGSDQLFMDKDKNLVSATISTHVPEYNKKLLKPAASIELKITEEDKPKPVFPKKLTRMDSFNRPDSPIREPMPLPKDSVIARNRRPRLGSSSSTDSDPGRSPRVSPRVVRKHKKMGGSDTSTLSVKHGREAKPSDQLLSPHGESSSSSRFSKSPQVGQGHILKDTVLSPLGKKEFFKGLPSQFTMGQQSSHSPAGVKSPPTEEWSTPPSTPRGDSRTRLMSPLSSSSSVAQTGASYASTRLSSLDKQSSTDTPQGALLGVTKRPGSGGIVSDSSNASSRKDKRRFRKREPEAGNDRSPSVEVIKVRPGKRDKSSVRKSALNVAEDIPDDVKEQDSDDLEDFYRQRPRSSGGSLTRRTPPTHTLSPTATKATESTPEPSQPLVAVGSQQSGIMPVAPVTRVLPMSPVEEKKETRTPKEQVAKVHMPVSIATSMQSLSPAATVHAPVSVTTGMISASQTSKVHEPVALATGLPAPQKAEVHEPAPQVSKVHAPGYISKEPLTPQVAKVHEPAPQVAKVHEPVPQVSKVHTPGSIAKELPTPQVAKVHTPVSISTSVQGPVKVSKASEPLKPVGTVQAQQPVVQPKVPVSIATGIQTQQERKISTPVSLAPSTSVLQTETASKMSHVHEGLLESTKVTKSSDVTPVPVLPSVTTETRENLLASSSGGLATSMLQTTATAITRAAEVIEQQSVVKSKPFPGRSSQKTPRMAEVIEADLAKMKLEKASTVTEPEPQEPKPVSIQDAKTKVTKSDMQPTVISSIRVESSETEESSFALTPVTKSSSVVSPVASSSSSIELSSGDAGRSAEKEKTVMTSTVMSLPSTVSSPPTSPASSEVCIVTSASVSSEKVSSSRTSSVEQKVTQVPTIEKSAVESETKSPIVTPVSTSVITLSPSPVMVSTHLGDSEPSVESPKTETTDEFLSFDEDTAEPTRPTESPTVTAPAKSESKTVTTVSIDSPKMTIKSEPKPYHVEETSTEMVVVPVALPKVTPVTTSVVTLSASVVSKKAEDHVDSAAKSKQTGKASVTTSTTKPTVTIAVTTTAHSSATSANANSKTAAVSVVTTKVSTTTTAKPAAAATSTAKSAAPQKPQLSAQDAYKILTQSAPKSPTLIRAQGARGVMLAQTTKTVSTTPKSTVVSQTLTTKSVPISKPVQTRIAETKVSNAISAPKTSIIPTSASKEPKTVVQTTVASTTSTQKTADASAPDEKPAGPVKAYKANVTAVPSLQKANVTVVQPMKVDSPSTTKASLTSSVTLPTDSAQAQMEKKVAAPLGITQKKTQPIIQTSSTVTQKVQPAVPKVQTPQTTIQKTAQPTVQKITTVVQPKSSTLVQKTQPVQQKSPATVKKGLPTLQKSPTLVKKVQPAVQKTTTASTVQKATSVIQTTPQKSPTLVSSIQAGGHIAPSKIPTSPTLVKKTQPAVQKTTAVVQPSKVKTLPSQLVDQNKSTVAAVAVQKQPQIKSSQVQPGHVTKAPATQQDQPVAKVSSMVTPAKSTSEVVATAKVGATTVVQVPSKAEPLSAVTKTTLVTQAVPKLAVTTSSTQPASKTTQQVSTAIIPTSPKVARSQKIVTAQPIVQQTSKKTTPQKQSTILNLQPVNQKVITELKSPTSPISTTTTKMAPYATTATPVSSQQEKVTSPLTSPVQTVHATKIAPLQMQKATEPASAKVIKDAETKKTTAYVNRVEEAITRLSHDRSSKSPAKEDITELRAKLATAKSKDVNKLVQQFTSAPESEGATQNKIQEVPPSMNHVQEAPPASPGRTRKVPERTQSLRISPDKEVNNVPKRAQSFRTDVKRRFKSADQQESELTKILNRRSRNLEEWEAQLAENPDATAAEKAVEEYEKQLEMDKQRKMESKDELEVLADTEVYSVLKARRANLLEGDVNANTEQSLENGTSKLDAPKSELKKTNSFESTTTIQIGSVKSEVQPAPVATPAAGLPCSPRLSRPTFVKAKTIDVSGVVDPELAQVLKARKEEGSEEEKEPDKPPPQRASPTLEAEGDDGEKRPSVMQRIFQMETKLEEEKFGSRNSSGLTTPRVMRLRSSQGSVGGSPRGGTASPRLINLQPSPVGGAAEQLMSDAALLEKLSDVAVVCDAAAARRQRFQQRNRDDWRVRTQPVTEEEVREADMLDTVQAFRAEIMRHTGINLFQEKSKVETAHIRRLPGQETVPLPFKREKLKDRRKNARYKTQPITVHELSLIPESDPLSPNSSDVSQNSENKAMSRKKQIRRKVEEIRAATVGYDSDSDFERLVDSNYRQLKAKAPINIAEENDNEGKAEDEKSKMSLAEKMALFRKLEDEEKKGQQTPKTARRFADRKKRLERSRTQPVTEDEVTLAAEYARNQQGQGSQASRAKSEEQEQGEEEPSEDELSKLSLAEKMRLFSEKRDDSTPQRRETPVIRRKARRGQSRFKTQGSPVTAEEVEKARISPLAMSLVKPPDPEILQTMSLKEQREYMAQHAESTLASMGSRPGSRSGSKPGSRRESLEGAEEKEEPKKGILRTKVEDSNVEVRGILKPERQSTPERDIRGILKPLPQDLNLSPIPKDSNQLTPPRGILKSLVTGSTYQESTPEIASAQETKGILKHESSLEGKFETENKGVLKKDSSFERRTEPEKGVLKKDTSLESKEVRSILKEPSFEVEGHTEPQGILKTTPPGGSSQTPAAGTSPMVTTTSIITISSKRQDSSTEEEFDRIARIKNEAVARRRMQRELRKQGERYNTQPVEGSSSPAEKRKAYIAHGRHNTEPVTEQEKDLLELRSESPSKVGGSIAARLASIQQSTDSDWRKRVVREMPEGEIDQSTEEAELSALRESGENAWKKRVSKTDSTAIVQMEGGVVEVKLRQRLGDNPERPSSIADRLNALQEAKDDWRQRVEEKDVAQFTVEGKLKMEGKPRVTDSPLMARKKRAFKPPLNRDSESSEGSVPPSPTKNLLPQFIGPTSSNTASPVISSLQRELASTLNNNDTPAKSAPLLITNKDLDEEEASTPSRIVVLRPDDPETFQSFFSDRSQRETSIEREKVEVSLDDFDHIFMESSDILESTKKARPQRRNVTSSRNPLKALAQRQDLQQEYTEVRTDIAEKELRRIKREQLAGTATFATDALAGLASKENFAKVMLRKADSFSGSTPGGTAKYDPYKNLMLLHIKGRRHCQIRLVEPSARSLNSGDCFILVTPERCIQWIGDYANVMEKAKIAEVASIIAKKNDLGCKFGGDPPAVFEQTQSMGPGKHFWKALGGQEPYQNPGPQEEDELYEMYMAECTKVYQVLEDRLLYLEDYSGCVPKYDFLDSKEAFVFDFGSEMYTWMGKQVPFNKRKVAMKLAKEIWDQGYDYSEYDINPLSPLLTAENGGLPMKGSQRPDWALFAKVNENMETVLFREKFTDWPEQARIIKVKGQDENETKNESIELKAYDAKKMIKIDESPVSLMLEGSHVGRGDTWVEIYQDLRREFEILTLNIDMWHVSEYDHFKLDPESYGQFHDGDTYVVRWHYMVSQIGMKNLKGQESSRHSLTGRERCAYFFWQGRYSGITEKGASALMTVELDEERGPQVRVVQGKEPPCFIRLFRNRMVAHRGKREDEGMRRKWRGFIVRNELKLEAYLKEVSIGTQHLRSRSSMLFVNTLTGLVYMWHGCKVSRHTRERCIEIAENLKASPPEELGLAPNVKMIITQMDEGNERTDFWNMMGNKDRTIYNSLLTDRRNTYNYSPRLFLMDSVSGEFVATEVLNPARHHEVASPFPFSQWDLYNASQPALFLVDNHTEVYLWQGWWPVGTEESENVRTGSANTRFNVDRRCALETVLDYCKEKNRSRPPPAYSIHAGLEPLQFTTLFPEWTVDPEVRDISLKEDKRDGEMVKVEDFLHRITRTRYTWDELQERPLPEGIDPLRLESYLDDHEFQSHLGLTREDFYAMPSWKQVKLKKDKGLF